MFAEPVHQDLIDMNRLSGETSPYLLQHQDNPVHWWPWCDAAFEEAQSTARPVLLSIGYAACHWCHVMAHESFENAETAALMNARFVNIKVDREERPDIDHVYMSSLHALGQRGGWPLTMFLTPERLPFWGGTYFPPVPRHGQPGFPDLLAAVADTFAQDPERVSANTEALRTSLNRLTLAHAGDLPGPSALDSASAQIANQLDPELGGFFGAPKFPNFPVLEFVWRRSSPDGVAGQRVLAALEGMSAGGIFDHLGGGLARYSVDDRWLVPHFEKMLYDNAGYVRLLASAWRSTRKPLFARRVAQTVTWMLDEMRLESGGLASSLDADSEGEEGRYYVWSAEEIDEILENEAPRFRAAYGVRADGNWEGMNILHQLDSGAVDGEDEFAPQREKLLARRRGRIPPGFDDKVLADWNGLAVAALAEAGAAFDRPTWTAAARDAFAFIDREMTTADGRLLHSWRAGQAQHHAMLDDYAFLADGALALLTADGEHHWLARAEQLMNTVLAHFQTEDGGLWRTADDGEALITRARSGHDDATPSGAGVAADVMARLWHVTLDDRWRTAAEKLVASTAGAAMAAPAAYPTVLAAADTLADAVDIVVEAQQPETPRAQALLRAAQEAPLPVRTVRRIQRKGSLPAGHAASALDHGNGQPRAYVCHQNACSLPVTTAPELVRLLEDIRAGTRQPT